jgi:hypothetical protein
MLRFYRRNWYYVGAVLFVILSYFMAFWGVNHMSHLQVIMVFSFMAMLVHQFEEYGLPGGFPSFFNIAFWGERKQIDSYPFNANTAMVNNVFLCYPFYIIGIIFPSCIWFGLIQVGQGMVQIWNHGYKNNKLLGTWYNPGLAAVLFLHWPLGIYYIYYVASNNLATTSDYVIGAIGSLLTMVVLWVGPVKLQATRTTKYPFDKDRMYGFGEKTLKDMLKSDKE